MQIEDVQRFWEVPAVAHFCSLFRQVFNLIDFDIEDFEEALVVDTVTSEEGGRSSLIVDLLVSLLRGMPWGMEASLLNYNQHLHALLDFRWVSSVAGKSNPLGPDPESASIHKLPLYAKLKVIHWLCEYRLECPDVEHATRNLSGESLRVHPLGQDNCGNTYWYFYGTRLYKEENAPVEPTKTTEKQPVIEKRLTRSPRKRRKANAYDFGKRRKKRPIAKKYSALDNSDRSDNSESEMGSQLSTISSSRDPSPTAEPVRQSGRSPRKSAGAEGIPCPITKFTTDHTGHDSSLNELIERMYSRDEDDDEDGVDSADTTMATDSGVGDTIMYTDSQEDIPAKIDDQELKTTNQIEIDHSSLAELAGTQDSNRSSPTAKRSPMECRGTNRQFPSVAANQSSAVADTSNSNHLPTATAGSKCDVTSSTVDSNNCSPPSEEFEFTYVDERGSSLTNGSSSNGELNVGRTRDVKPDMTAVIGSALESTVIEKKVTENDSEQWTTLTMNHIKNPNFAGKIKSEIDSSLDENFLCSENSNAGQAKIELLPSKLEPLGENASNVELNENNVTDSKNTRPGPPPWDQPSLREPEKLRWSLICGTIEHWTNLVNQFEKATTKVESELYTILKNDFQEAIEELFKQREKEMQKKVTELGSRRVSDRLELRKLQHQQQNEDLQQREKTEMMRVHQLDEEKRMRTLKEEREVRAKERELRAKEREKEREKQKLIQEQNREERAKRLEARQRRVEHTADGKPIPQDLLNDTISKVISASDKELSEIEKEIEYDYMIGQLDKVLQAVQNDVDAWPFLEPVTEEIAPSYFELIENPMDLGTIERKLEAREYKTKIEFVSDLNTMFLNCLQYNRLESDYTRIAHRLERAMITAWKQYFPLADLHDLSNERRKEEVEAIKLLGALDRDVKAALHEDSSDSEDTSVTLDSSPASSQSPVVAGIPAAAAVLLHSYGQKQHPSQSVVTSALRMNPIRRDAALLRTNVAATLASGNAGSIGSGGEQLGQAAANDGSGRPLIVHNYSDISDLLTNNKPNDGKVTVVSSDNLSSYQRPGFNRNPVYPTTNASCITSLTTRNPKLNITNRNPVYPTTNASCITSLTTRNPKLNITKQPVTIQASHPSFSSPGSRIVLVSSSPVKSGAGPNVVGPSGLVPGASFIQPKTQPNAMASASQAEFNESNLPFNRMMKLESSDRLNKNKQGSIRTLSILNSPPSSGNNMVHVQPLVSSSPSKPVPPIRAASSSTTANGAPIAHVLINGKLVPVRLTTGPTAPGSGSAPPIIIGSPNRPQQSIVGLKGVQLFSSVPPQNNTPGPGGSNSSSYAPGTLHGNSVVAASPQPVNLGVRKIAPGNNLMTISLQPGGGITAASGAQTIQLGSGNVGNFVSNAPDKLFVMANTVGGNSFVSMGQQACRIPVASTSGMLPSSLSQANANVFPSYNSEPQHGQYSQRVVSIGGKASGESLPVVMPDGKTSIQRGKDGFIYEMERKPNGELTLRSKYSDDNLPATIALALAQANGSAGYSIPLSSGSSGVSGQLGFVSVAAHSLANSTASVVFSSPVSMQGRSVAVAAAVMGGSANKPVCSVTPQPRQTLASPTHIVLNHTGSALLQNTPHIQASDALQQQLISGDMIQQSSHGLSGVLTDGSGTGNTLSYGQMVSSVPHQQVVILQSPPSGSSLGMTPWAGPSRQQGTILNVAGTADGPSLIMSNAPNGNLNCLDNQLLNLNPATHGSQKSEGGGHQPRHHLVMTSGSPGNILSHMQQQPGQSSHSSVMSANQLHPIVANSSSFVSAGTGQALQQMGVVSSNSNNPVQFIQVMQPQIVVNTIPPNQVPSITFQSGSQSVRPGKQQQLLPGRAELGNAPSLTSAEGPGSPDLLAQAWKSIQDS